MCPFCMRNAEKAQGPLNAELSATAPAALREQILSNQAAAQLSLTRCAAAFCSGV